MNPIEVIDALTAGERSRLADLEGVIDRGLDTVFAVGRALIAIREEGLYRAAAPTFEAYIEQRWAMGKTRGYQLIDAAQIRDLTSTIVEAPPIPNEGMARELAPMLRQPDAATRIPEAWQKVIEQHAGDGPITAREVRKLLYREKYVTAFGRDTGGRFNVRFAVGGFGDKVRKLSTSLEYLLTQQLRGRDVTPGAREMARQYAGQLRVMAGLLDDLADGQTPTRADVITRLEGGDA